MFYFKNIIRTCHLLCNCVRDPRCYHAASKAQVAERIFKLSQILTSVIYQISWIRWNFWSIYGKLHFRADDNKIFLITPSRSVTKNWQVVSCTCTFKCVSPLITWDFYYIQNGLMIDPRFWIYLCQAIM